MGYEIELAIRRTSKSELILKAMKDANAGHLLGYNPGFNATMPAIERPAFNKYAAFR